MMTSGLQRQSTSQGQPELRTTPVQSILATLFSMLVLVLGWSSAGVSAEAQTVETVVARVNAGGGAVSADGKSWSADQFAAGGKTYTNPDVTEIQGTDADVLYLTEHSATTDLGTFAYNIPVPNAGMYTVNLHFAEIYWGAPGGGAGGTGQRVFSVEVEGTMPADLQDIDLNEEVGPVTATVKTVQVDVNDGTLNLNFTASVNQPKVSAIEVLGIQDLNGPPEIEIENLDGVPFADRLVMSRLNTDPDGANPAVHDVSTLRVLNTGSGILDITGLTIADNGSFELVNPFTATVEVLPGESFDIPVRFIATTTDDPANRNIESTLSIATNDDDEPNVNVELAGIYQRRPEGGTEPNVAEIVEAFGYGTTILGPGDQLDNMGLITTIGDEVLSPYWQRANTSEPVEVRQLAAYHSCCSNTATVFWHQKGSNSTNAIFTHNGQYAQTLLPLINGSSGNFAEGTFTPSSALFGFKIDPEWSDPSKNNTSPDVCSSDPDLDASECGHHVRFWPAEDREGNRIPDTFLMVMDYSGINYDFNDNVYLVSNIQPENAQPTLANPLSDAQADTDDTAETIALDGVFADFEDGTTGFTYEVTSSDESVVSASTIGSSLELTYAGVTGSATITVTATDSGGATVSDTFTVTVTEVFAGCLNYSTLDCDDTLVSLPLSLSFDGTEGGLSSTGFTIAAPQSAPLSTPSDPNINGYEPGLLDVSSGALGITTTAGIFFKDPSQSTETNSQVNALGVALAPQSQPVVLETTLSSLPSGLPNNSFQQGGLWFGLGEANYVKLVALHTGNGNFKVQVGYELGDMADSGDERNTDNNTLAEGDGVRLRLVLDPVNNTATGFFSTDGGQNYTQVEAGVGAVPIDASLFDGIALPDGQAGPVSFAGVLATHRRADVSTVFTFEDFEASGPLPPALAVSPASVPLTTMEGTSVNSAAITVSTDDNSTTTYSIDTAALPSWLSVSDPTGTTEGTFSLTADAASLAPGPYSATLDITASGYASASVDVTLDVTAAVDAFTANVNFSDEGTAPPNGYLKDFGQPYGVRSSADQGSGTYSYGWVEPGTSSPVDLANADNGAGRNRSSTGQNDLRLATLIHMDYPLQDNNTIRYPRGSWEIEVPNGSYEVTVAVGEADEGSDPEIHALNIEGVEAIYAFEPPTNSDGDDSRHTVVTMQVGVEDGRLTVDEKGGTNTKINYIDISQILPTRPYAFTASPANRSLDAFLDAVISTNLFAPGSGVGVDIQTLSGNVHLYEVNADGSNGTEVFGSVGSSGGNDVIVFTPDQALAENTTYRFVVDGGANGVQSEVGDDFLPFASLFTTGTDVEGGGGGDEFTPVSSAVSFDPVDLNIDGVFFSTLTFGPDGKLYGLTISGQIYRYTVNADGTLTNEEILDGVASSGPRAAVGLVFDEDATANNLVAWVTHAIFGGLSGGTVGERWGSKVSRLSGPDLEVVNDVFVNLPRSAKDHLTNSITYGPDGNLYFLQGSNLAAGAPDNSWGTRPETKLTAAVLTFDEDAVWQQVQQSGPIDVKTDEPWVGGSDQSVGSYDPFAPGAPLKVYASGVRNAYDLVWHSNGNLYVPTNGTAAGGQSPDFDPNNPPAGLNCSVVRGDGLSASQLPAVAGINSGQTHEKQRDFLFRIEEDGYYGHPNPSRCEWILNIGNPNASNDEPGEGQNGSEYAVGTPADPNYRGYPNFTGGPQGMGSSVWDFDFNKSPNGVIEYQGANFGGELQGRLMVVRFSGNDDIYTLEVDTQTGGFLGAQPGNEITGFDGGSNISYDDPLELVENPATGDIYLAQYDRGGSNQKLFLLRPTDRPDGTETPLLAVSDPELIFSGPQNETRTQAVTVTNSGTGTLTVGDAQITGPNAGAYSISPQNATLGAGASETFTVTFNPSGTQGVLSADLTFQSNVGNEVVGLYALSAQGYEGSNEPTLQDAVTTLGYNLDTGWTGLAGGTAAEERGDEVYEPLFKKADPDEPVTIVPVARYSPAEQLPFGYYEDGMESGLNVVGTLQSGEPEHQTLFPPLASGSTSFDPGAATFGIFVDSGVFNHVRYTEDELNSIARGARIYPLDANEATDRRGESTANRYLIGFEDASNGDYQDYVFVLSNVLPADEQPPVAACEPYSILDCDDIPVALPFTLTFDGTEGGLSDGDMDGTGFTAVADPSARFEDLDIPAYPNVLGYEPQYLDVMGGVLQIEATQGIFYKEPGSSSNTNSQLNALSVGFDASTPDQIVIETTLEDLPSLGSSQSQQAGIWFGLGEDNYVKLVAGSVSDTGYKVQIAHEIDAQASGDTELNTVQVLSDDGTADVTLRLVLDPDLNTAAGFYSIDGGTTFTQVTGAIGGTDTEELALDPSFFAGLSVEADASPVSFAGILATTRRADAGLLFTFSDFSIEGEGLTQLATFDVPLSESWNIAALPLDPADRTTQSVFPTVTSAFGYAGGYASASELEPGEGYWLKSSQATTQTVEGTTLTRIEREVEAGWVLLGGASCTIPRESISGSAVLSSASLFAYDGGYVASASLEQGRGYWAKIASGGTLVLDCTAPAPQPALAAAKAAHTPAKGPADAFGRIEVSDATGRSRALFYGASLGSPAERDAFLLPPKAPAGGFDVRFANDAFLTQSHEGVVSLEASAYPVRVSFGQAPSSAAEALLTVEERANGRVTATHTLRVGEALEIRDASVAELRIAATEDLPLEFALHGNYPNPTRGRTSLAFDLPEAADVKVEVYNILGQRVMRMAKAQMQPGANQVLQLDGSSLASGSYFYRMTVSMPSKTLTKTGRMVLVR